MKQPYSSRRRFLATVGAAAGVALAGCSSNGGSGAQETGSDSTPTATREPTPEVDWRTTAVTDVRTDEQFTIESLAGAPVLLEFFAVWCPVCTRQQRQMGALLDRREDVVAVSINTDPNENAETVREHVESKGFDWRYVVAPPEMTRAFVDEFGSVVASPPSAPVVRVCPDGTAALLEGTSVKGVETLSAALDEC